MGLSFFDELTAVETSYISIKLAGYGFSSVFSFTGAWRSGSSHVPLSFS